MKKIWVYGGAGFGLVVLLIVVIPFLISWNQYKNLIQQQFVAATGRSLVIQGDLRFALLPSPRATLTDVVIGNPSGTLSKQFATIKQLEVGVALRPLLARRVQVTQITVTDPAITLETLADGSTNWNFSAPAKNTVTSQPADEKEATASALQIDDLKIVNGFVRIVNTPKKTQNVVGPLTGNFQMASIQGPFTGRGTVTLAQKIPVRFSVKVDEMASDTAQPVPFTAEMNLLGGAANLDLKGQFTRSPHMVAQVTTAFSTKHLDKIIGAVPAPLSPQTTVTGDMDYRDDTLRISNLLLQSGGFEASAAVNVALAERTRVTLDLKNMQFPADSASVKAAHESASLASTQSLAETMRSSFEKATALLDTTLPNLGMDVVFTADQFAWPQQPTLRDVRIAASSDEKGIVVQNVSARLAGETAVRLNGLLQKQANGTLGQITLQADITSTNIQAALGNKTKRALPMQVQTTMLLNRQAFRLEPLRVVQQGEAVNGSILYQPRKDPALQVAMKGEALDLDAFMGKKKAAATKGANNNTVQAETSSNPLMAMKGLKAQIAVDIQKLIWQQKQAKNVQVNAQISDTGLVLQQAKIGDLGGAVVQAMGTIGGFNPLQDVAIKVNARTANLSTTLRALGNKSAQNIGASQLDATITGSENALRIASSGTLEQGTFALNATASDVSAPVPTIKGTVTLNHPETATIVRNFAKMNPKENFGAFALKTNFVSSADTLQANDLVVKLGSAGTLTGDISKTPQNAHVKLDADRLDLAGLMGEEGATENPATAATTPSAAQGWSNTPLDFSTWKNVTGDAAVRIGALRYKKFDLQNLIIKGILDKGALKLDKAAARLFDAGNVSASGQMVLGAQNQAHQGQFDVVVEKADAQKLFVALGSKPFRSGTIDTTQKIRFVGASPAQMISSLDGGGTITITDGVINGIDLDALAAKLDKPNSLGDFAAILDQTRAGGQTPIGTVALPIILQKGVVSLSDTEIKTQKTTMGLRGLANLPTQTVDMTGQIRFIEQRNLPALALFVRGPMANPQKSFDTRGFTQFYAQKAAVKLQEKLQDRLGKMLGGKKEEQQQAAPAPVSGSDVAPVSPVPPASPASPAPAALPPAKPKDQLKQLGTEMLQNILGGGR